MANFSKNNCHTMTQVRCDMTIIFYYYQQTSSFFSKNEINLAKMYIFYGSEENIISDDDARMSTAGCTEAETITNIVLTI